MPQAPQSRSFVPGAKFCARHSQEDTDHPQTRRPTTQVGASTAPQDRPSDPQNVGHPTTLPGQRHIHPATATRASKSHLPRRRPRPQHDRRRDPTHRPVPSRPRRPPPQPPRIRPRLRPRTLHEHPPILGDRRRIPKQLRPPLQTKQPRSIRTRKMRRRT
jgi:hypothetical protein